MKKLLLGFLLIPFLGFAQKVDYSQLSRKEKLKYLNYYGFVVLQSEDTIFAKVTINKHTNTPSINSQNELILSYPDDLAEYSYKTKIPLNSIKSFYFGYPRKTNFIKQYENTFLNLEKIDVGKYEIYKELIIIPGGELVTPPPNTQMGSWITKDSTIEVLYVCKSNGKLIRIEGSKNEKRQMLAKLLKNELTEKKLSKIKTSNYKIIELIKGLNENNILR